MDERIESEEDGGSQNLPLGAESCWIDDCSMDSGGREELKKIKKDMKINKIQR